MKEKKNARRNFKKKIWFKSIIINLCKLANKTCRLCYVLKNEFPYFIRTAEAAVAVTSAQINL